MNLLIVTNSSSGLYKFRKELINELIKKGHNINVITPDSGYIYELKDLGCSIQFINMNRRGKNIFSELKLLLMYKNLIKKYNPDKLISYTIKPNIYCGLITRLYKIDFYPNITGIGTTFQKKGVFRKLIVKSYRIAFKNVKKVFFENYSNNDLFIKEKICSKNNSVVLNGAGVNLDEYKFEKMPSLNSTNFLFMGRIMKEKGIDELFQAIKSIKSKYNRTYFSILGEFEEEYKEKIEELESKNLIKYYGKVRDVRPYIKNNHCILLPSHHEGMSNTLLEGAAMGRALITSNIPGCKEAVYNNKSGFLHNVKDYNDLTKKMEKFITLSDEKKIDFGKVSRKIIEEKFDKKVVVNKTIKNILK